MNIINKILLRFALLPASLYRKMGVNTTHLRVILTVKLMMDDRRPNTFHQTRPRKSDKAISSATLGTILLSGFMGFFFLFSFQISNNLITQLIIYFSLYMVMLVSTLISDFTSVLIDVRDNYIIFPKPVSDKTFVLSRLLHILLHITKIVVPMSLPAIIYLAIFNSYLTAIVYFVMALLAAAFCIFLINIIYLIILKFTSPKKFQVFISYAQIFMTIIIFGGYQIGVQVLSKMDINSFTITPNLWFWLLPSYWFSLGTKFFTVFVFEIPLVIGALLTLLVPPLALWTVIRYFAPSFNQKLSLITGNSEESTAPVTSYKNNTTSRILLADRLANLFAKKGEERMGFLLTWKLTGRLRDFKLKVYPSVGYLLVFVVVAIYNDKNFLSKFGKEHSDNRNIVMSMVYFSSFILMSALGQIQFSEKYKAAWFYFTTPVKKPGLIFSGTLKAVIIKFYLPLVLVLSLIMTSLLGISIVPNIILGMLNVFLGCWFLSLIVLRNFPFSALQQTSQKIGAIFRSMFSLGLVGLLGFLQSIAYNIPVVVIISIVLSGLANWLLLDYIKNKSWAQVLATYND